VALPFGTPFTAHVTVVSSVLATVAANIARCVAASVAVGGETLTVIPPPVTVTVAAALSAPPLGCGLTIACTVIGFCDGSPAGAVYSAEVEPLAAIVPSAGLPPAIPFTSHVMLCPAARQNAAEKLCVRPNATFTEDGEIALETPHVIVTLAPPDLEVSSALVAVTVTVAGDGGADGAVYVAAPAPVLAIVPIVELPPAIPFTLHVTPDAALPNPEMFAVNTCSPLVGTFAVGGDTVIATLSLRLTFAESLADESASLTAVTVTLGGDGTAAGAVYVAVPPPVVEIVPPLEFPPATPFTSHETFVSDVPVTVA